MTLITQPTQTYTIDGFFALPDDGQHHELVKGVLLTMPLTGIEHSRISSRLYTKLSGFADQHQLGEVYGGDAGFIINAAEKTVRGPNVSFIDKKRIPVEVKGFFPMPPDLAVEIISPNDLYSEVDEKVEEYQQAGVRLVWVINPRRKQVAIYRGTNPIPQNLGVNGTLTAKTWCKAFHCPSLRFSPNV